MMMMNWEVAEKAQEGLNCANCAASFDNNSKKAHKFLLSDNSGGPDKPILREITILESLSELFNLKSLSQLQCNESGSKTENTHKFLSVRLCPSCANLLANVYKLYFDFNHMRSKSSFLEREIQRNRHCLALKNNNRDDNNSDSSSSSCSTNRKTTSDQVKIYNNNNNSDTRTENIRRQLIINPQQKIPGSNHIIMNSYHPPPLLLKNQPQQQQQQQDRIVNNINNKATIIIQDIPKLPSYSKPKSLIMNHYNNSSSNTTDDDEGPIIVDCKSISKEQMKPNYNPTVPFLLHQALTSRSPSYSPKESTSNNNSNESPPTIRTNKLINPILNTQESTERGSNVIGMNLNRGSILIQTRTVSELEITRITDRITDEISPPPPPTSHRNIINNKVNNSNNSSSTSSNQEHWRKRHCNTNFDSKNSKFSKIIIENPPDENKTFKCGECRAVFESFQQLSSHIQLHLPGAEKFYNEALIRKKSTERN